jgi:hypothetical protein
MIESENDNGDCSNSSSAASSASNTLYVTFPCHHQFSSTLSQCPLCQEEDWTPSHFYYATVILFVLAFLNMILWSVPRMITKEDRQALKIDYVVFLASFLNTFYSTILTLWIQLSKLHLWSVFYDISNFHANYMRKIGGAFRFTTVVNIFVIFLHGFDLNFLNIVNYLAILVVAMYHIHGWHLMKEQLITQ